MKRPYKAGKTLKNHMMVVGVAAVVGDGSRSEEWGRER